MGLQPDISGISGTVTGPSHSPARLFMVAKDFCASGTRATEDFCASDCAKAMVASNIRTADRTKRRDFIVYSPASCNLTTVIVNYNTAAHVKVFFVLDVAFSRRSANQRLWLWGFTSLRGMRL